MQLNLLDSHDMARFLTLARGDLSALRLATLFQMTYPGAPSIYYGDEIGMSGGHDPANRGAFPWHSSETWDTDLLHDFQRLIALRKSRPALRRGSFQFLHAHDDVIAYARQLGDETVVVALNVSAASKRVDLPLDGPPARRRRPRRGLGARVGRRSEAGMLRGLRLGPRSGRVFATPPPMNGAVRPARLAAARGGQRLALAIHAHTPAGRGGGRVLPRAIPCSRPTPGRSTPGSSSPGRWSTWAAARAGMPSGSPVAGFPVVAVDLSRAMLRAVGGQGRGEGLALLGVEANLCRLGCFPDATFDYALSMFSTLGMIRGATARSRALAEAFRILRPGGRLALHAHNLWLNLRDRQGRRLAARPGG